MRPRLPALAVVVFASMRPRLITSENARETLKGNGPGRSFNEAEADHLGKLRLTLEARDHLLASMRPRLITSENPIGDHGSTGRYELQ